MLKNLTLAGLLALGTLAFVQTARSDDINDHTQPAPSSEMKTGSTVQRNTDVAPENLRQATVTVIQVDPMNHKVRFEAQVQPEANLMQNGQPIRLDQLKEGDQVRASFDPATGEVVKLDVLRAKR